jgi:hypothetical protein
MDSHSLMVKGVKAHLGITSPASHTQMKNVVCIVGEEGKSQLDTTSRMALTKKGRGAGNETHWWSACLAFARLCVPSPIPQKQNRSNEK